MIRRARLHPVDIAALIGSILLVVGVGMWLGTGVAIATLGVLIITVAVLAARSQEAT